MVADLKLKMVDDADTMCYYLPKKEAMKLDVTLPPNMLFKPLTTIHVEKINSVWPHRYEGSDQFILYSIEHHLNVGLFDGTELTAWSIIYDSGSIGVMQVDENHLRKGYGSLIVKAISKQFVEEFDVDVTALIANTNVKSLNMFMKLGFKESGRHSWFVLNRQ